MSVPQAAWKSRKGPPASLFRVFFFPVVLFFLFRRRSFLSRPIAPIVDRSTCQLTDSDCGWRRATTKIHRASYFSRFFCLCFPNANCLNRIEKLFSLISLFSRQNGISWLHQVLLLNISVNFSKWSRAKVQHGTLNAEAQFFLMKYFDIMFHIRIGLSDLIEFSIVFFHQTFSFQVRLYWCFPTKFNSNF